MIIITVKPTTTLPPTTTTFQSLPCPENVTREVLQPSEVVQIKYNMYNNGQVVENVIKMKAGENFLPVPVGPDEWCTLHVIVRGKNLLLMRSRPVARL